MAHNKDNDRGLNAVAAANEKDDKRNVETEMSKD
jgi:hypothetical protein